MLTFEGNLLVRAFGAAGADLLFPVGILIAMLVSVHVLLNQRDAGTAMGWMGLTWLSPFVGGALYALFGVNRVNRRAREVRHDGFAPRRDDDAPALPASCPQLAPLAQAGARITGRALLAGNEVEVLRCGDEAYPVMLDAIRGARRSVALATYILRDDAAGGAFIDALIAAKGRGVQVRVLIDGIGSGYFYSAAYHRLSRSRVPVGRFMHSPLPWRMPFLNLRTHMKVLVADGQVGFAGGLNIGAENVLAGGPRHPVRDTHFRLRGPAVGQLVEAFAMDWSFVKGEELSGEAWFPALDAAGPDAGRVVTSGPDADIQKTEFLILEAVGRACRSVRIQTPYFLPDERLVTALALASLRGVAVDVVVPVRNNHFFMDWALRANVGPLLWHGCRIWLDAPPFDHSKLMVVDDVWCLIGSANWDARSFRLNFELNVEIYSSALARQLTEMMAAREGVPLTADMLDARSLPVRLRDAAVRLLLPYL
jgi:cardiolipin synthase